MHILDAIGNTSMVRLREIVPANGAEIQAKLEWENPTGSMKAGSHGGARRRADARHQRRALFAGTSSGANVIAAIQVAERLGPKARVVTLMADSGLKYLSTDVYRRG